MEDDIQYTNIKLKILGEGAKDEDTDLTIKKDDTQIDK